MNKRHLSRLLKGAMYKTLWKNFINLAQETQFLFSILTITNSVILSDDHERNLTFENTAEQLKTLKFL